MPNDGSFYLVGKTSSSLDGDKFQTTQDAWQKAKSVNGTYEGYVAKFNNNGTKLNSFTFFGGNGDDIVMDINLFHSKQTANNDHDSVAIAGITSSYNGGTIPLSLNASIISDKLDGDGLNPGNDAFFSVITGTNEGLNSQKVSFSAYVGGSNLEKETNSYGPSIALGPNGAEYIAFATQSDDVKTISKVTYPTAETYSGGDDVFVGTIYPFQEHFLACPTCNPCRVGESETNIAEQVEFYPVPFDNEVNLNVVALKDGEALIRIYNSIAEEVLIQKIIVVEGINTTSINFYGQSSGIYLCRIEIDDKIEVAKIIKE